MRKPRLDGAGVRGIDVVMMLCAFYLVVFGLYVLHASKSGGGGGGGRDVLSSSGDGEGTRASSVEAMLPLPRPRTQFLGNERQQLVSAASAPPRPRSHSHILSSSSSSSSSSLPPFVFHLQHQRRLADSEAKVGGLDAAAAEAISLGSMAWQDVAEAATRARLQLQAQAQAQAPQGIAPSMAKEKEKEKEKKREWCQQSISARREGSARTQPLQMLLPCGLRVGSSITVVGRPRRRGGSGELQFRMELQGLALKETKEGVVVEEEEEDPPRVFHFNPRIRGDWSGRPVIEHNTCYRMQWASAQRCDGSESLSSNSHDDTVDGLPKCEKWITDVGDDQKQSRSTWWLNRLIGHTKKASVDWPYPFVEDRLFVLTINAGLEGYHVNVDGKHVTSFPYRTGFVLEDATGFFINGAIEVNTVVATALPSSHSSFSPQNLLDMSDKWKAPALPAGPVDLFIGILSAGNHFAERMAVRKTWMQSNQIKSSKVVARFFVALSARKEINMQLNLEAEFFGDMIIVPFIDNYDLVVLKTVAICKYGVQNLSARYIMKCDDDNFVRLDAVLKEIDRLSNEGSLYMGNLNYRHKPLRRGKWAVTFEEWPEDDYPPYANGPGYIISSDIADFIVSLHLNQTLRLFKMEDVSMGMWVEQFNASTPVHYSHDWKFCQFGCIDDYFTAHYQSPRQMICMWDKLSDGKAQCCNMR